MVRRSRERVSFWRLGTCRSQAPPQALQDHADFVRLRSLRRDLCRHIDSVRCSFLKRMSGQIDLLHQRLVAGVDRISERVLIALELVVGREQADPGATRANYPRRILQARIESLRIRRSTQVEPLRTNLHRISNDLVFSADVGGE